MNDLNRRQFLRRLAVAAPVLAFPDTLLAMAEPAMASSRELRFAHTHTGERLTVEYFTSGRYVPDALAAIDHHLRDFRTGEVIQIDRGLLDLLNRLAGATGSSKPFQVISGYRSPKTNQMLRSKSNGVAASSLHMKGMAIDIRLADVPLPKLRQAAMGLRRGGVGFYPGPNFVHVDTGRVRQW
jgi:uncharacterized protein YcbK (DUF882 family)